MTYTFNFFYGVFFESSHTLCLFIGKLHMHLVGVKPMTLPFIPLEEVPVEL